MKKLLIIFILVFTTHIGLAEQPVKNNKKLSQDFISKAKSANDRAIKLKNEWRDTRKLIKKAKKAHKNKKYKESMKFSKEALNQANMAIQQHNRQKNSYHFFE